MTSNSEESDDDSFVEFYRQHCGIHPSNESEIEYVNALRAARKESKERRKDAEFEQRYEEWWQKKNGNNHASLLWKEQMRSIVKFKTNADQKQQQQRK